MTDLLPCPFCGRADLLGVEPAPEGGFLVVMCRACGAHGPVGRGVLEDAEAVANWNRRPAPPSSSGETTAARHWCLGTKAARVGRLEDCRDCDVVAEHIAKELVAPAPSRDAGTDGGGA